MLGEKPVKIKLVDAKTKEEIPEVFFFITVKPRVE